LVVSTGLILLAGLSLPGAEAADWSPNPAIFVDLYTPDEGAKIYVGTQVDARCASMDMDTLDGNQYPDTIPEDNITWSASRGTFPNGNTGSDVVWQAPDTPSAQANDIWIKVTVDDLPAEKDPPGGGTRDDDPVTDTIYVTAWDIEIAKCAADWHPTHNNQTSITATILPTGVAGYITFELDSSNEKGYCMNAGDAYTNDLQILAGENPDFDVTSIGSLYWGTTKSEENSATVKVNSYDQGSYGTIQARTTIEEVTKWAHVPGSTDTVVDIPRDDNDNYIADGWTEFGAETGNASDDNETSPAGDGTAGDGFTRYEEYRGFVVDGTLVRNDPITTKDVFLCDEDGLGNEDFDATGLTIHMLASDGSEYSGSRVVNFNGSGGSPGGHTNQKGIRMYDGGYHEDYFGLAEQVGTPNVCDWVKIYTEKIREYYAPTDNWTTWDPQDIDVKKWVIGHECGHDVNLAHHEAGAAADCVMHRWGPANQDPYDDPEQIAHTYCGDELEDCLHSFKVH